MCIACFSIAKRPLLAWFEQQGYIAGQAEKTSMSQAEQLPNFAKPSLRQWNFWLDLFLETAMILCISHHPFTIPVLFIYYAAELYYFGHSVNDAQQAVMLEHYRANQDVGSSEPGASEQSACTRGCECPESSKLPKGYQILDSDQSNTAQAYRRLRDFSEKFSSQQSRYNFINVCWSLGILLPSLLIVPGVSTYTLALVSLSRFLFTEYVYESQSKLVDAYYGAPNEPGQDVAEAAAPTPSTH